MSSAKKVRVRFAPSPTGYLHIGGARSMLFNWLFARHFGGTMILRIEDTDEVRSTREFEEMQRQDIAWLGLTCDESPPRAHENSSSGSHGPYRQSERRAIYKKYSDELLSSGKAYYC